MITVCKYSIDFEQHWNDFILNSKNSSFLFDRKFMDYHSDRFNDYSLMAFKDSTLVAVMPANLTNENIISHQGLSYGGIVLHNEIRLFEAIEVVKSILVYLNENCIRKLVLKFIPRMYHKRPSDELDWIMFKLSARLFRRDTALVIDNTSQEILYQDRRRRSIKKASKNDIKIKEGINEIDNFWKKILVPNLLIKHGVKPVHTLKEIQLLAQRFPENIKQHNIYLDNEIVAGCTMFLNKKIAHAQYISGSLKGRDSGCLDLLFDNLIKSVYSSFNYFDFGICNEDDGNIINNGLLDWKEGFGARTISHDFYEIDTDKYNLLENIKV